MQHAVFNLSKQLHATDSQILVRTFERTHTHFILLLDSTGSNVNEKSMTMCKMSQNKRSCSWSKFKTKTKQKRSVSQRFTSTCLGAVREGLCARVRCTFVASVGVGAARAVIWTSCKEKMMLSFDQFHFRFFSKRCSKPASVLLIASRGEKSKN